MKKYIIALFLAFVFAPVAHGQSVPCQPGDLFNTRTGQPCPLPVVETDVAELQAIITDLRETIEDLKDEIRELRQDGNTGSTDSSYEEAEPVERTATIAIHVSESQFDVQDGEDLPGASINLEGLSKGTLESTEVTLKLNGETLSSYDIQASCGKSDTDPCSKNFYFGPLTTLKGEDTLEYSVEFMGKEYKRSSIVRKSGSTRLFIPRKNPQYINYTE